MFAVQHGVQHLIELACGHSVTQRGSVCGKSAVTVMMVVSFVVFADRTERNVSSHPAFTRVFVAGALDRPSRDGRRSSARASWRRGWPGPGSTPRCWCVLNGGSGRLRRDEKRAGDLLVRQAAGDEPQHLDLAAGQSRRPFLPPPDPMACGRSTASAASPSRRRAATSPCNSLAAALEPVDPHTALPVPDQRSTERSFGGQPESRIQPGQRGCPAETHPVSAERRVGRQAGRIKRTLFSLFWAPDDREGNSFVCGAVAGRGCLVLPSPERKPWRCSLSSAVSE